MLKTSHSALQKQIKTQLWKYNILLLQYIWGAKSKAGTSSFSPLHQQVYFPLHYCYVFNWKVQLWLTDTEQAKPCVNLIQSCQPMQHWKLPLSGKHLWRENSACPPRQTAIFFACYVNKACSAAVCTEMLNFSISESSHLRKGIVPRVLRMCFAWAALALLGPGFGLWRGHRLGSAPLSCCFMGHGMRRSLAVLEIMTIGHKKVSRIEITVFLSSPLRAYYISVQISSLIIPFFWCIYTRRGRRGEEAVSVLMELKAFTPTHSSKMTQPKGAPSTQPRLPSPIPTYSNNLRKNLGVSTPTLNTPPLYHKDTTNTCSLRARDRYHHYLAVGDESSHFGVVQTIWLLPLQKGKIVPSIKVKLLLQLKWNPNCQLMLKCCSTAASSSICR